MLSPAEIAAELRRIAAKHCGVARPEDVIEESRAADAVLHGKFTWDDGAAAHQFRLHQARQLLRVSVEIEPRPEAATITVPVFTSLGNERGQGYRPTEAVRADKDLSLQRDIDVLKQVERLLARANSPRLNRLLHSTALLLAKLESDAVRAKGLSAKPALAAGRATVSP
jgi:hypothetical protein